MNITTLDKSNKATLSILSDNRLTWKAIGIFAFLSSSPDGNSTMPDLVAVSKDGKDGVKSGIDELVKFGYVSLLKS